MSVLTVGELSRRLKALVGADDALQDAWVQGEITGFSRSTAGHCYFSLKDEVGVLPCVLFRNIPCARELPPEVLRNGVDILAHGRVAIYEGRGQYQLIVDAIQPQGEGYLHLRFEQMKNRLEAEGLFAGERKRPLPERPRCIAVVTSLQAAALRDVIRTLRNRRADIRVVVVPVLVQGDAAAAEIAQGIDYANQLDGPELILLTRGGGSIEELWAFNEERVARAIASSRLPVLSAIGHETDHTISDYVADYRAATPTAGAAACVPDHRFLRREVWERSRALGRVMQARRDRWRMTIDDTERHVLRLHPKRGLGDARERLATSSMSLRRVMAHRVERIQETARLRVARLGALNPLATLHRGYAIVRDRDSGEPILFAADATLGRGLDIQFQDGTACARVESRVMPEKGATHGQ